MALKLAKAMGAEVTLFSRSLGKETDARRLGADNIVISTESDQMADVAGNFDVIIDTVPYNHVTRARRVDVISEEADLYLAVARLAPDAVIVGRTRRPQTCSRTSRRLGGMPQAVAHAAVAR